MDEKTGLYYYGARYYDARTSVWLAVDPLAEKYPGLSPYAFVANNPIIYIDPDGREIKGVVVKFDEQGNKTLDYSKASKAAKRVFSAMLKTETGTSSAIALAETQTKVTLKTSRGKSPDGGSYAETKGSDQMNDDGTYKSATITFFEGEFNADQKSGTGKFGDTDSTLDEFYNILGVHEGVHLDPEQIQKDLTLRTHVTQG